MHYQIIANYERTLYGFEFWIGSRKYCETELIWQSREEAEQAANELLTGEESDNGAKAFRANQR